MEFYQCVHIQFRRLQGCKHNRKDNGRKKSEKFSSDKGTEKDSDFQEVCVTEGKHS